MDTVRGFAFAVVLLSTGSGCATERAALSRSVARTYGIEGAGAETAFASAVVAARGLGFSVNEMKGERRFYAQRGSGIGEFTSMEARIRESAAGVVEIDLVAKSSEDGGSVIEEFLSAYRKHVRIK